MDIAAPVHAPGGERLPAVVLLEIETDKLVAARSLERPDDTAETLLVRVAGGEVFYLNDVRYPDALKRGRASGADGELIAAQAARGARGVVTGMDYAGVPVFAAIAEVPRTELLIITKVDAAELRGLIRYRASLVIAAFVTMLLLMAVAAYQTLRRREAAARLHGQEERARLAAIVDGADDAIVSSDLDRIITTWNPAAERLFGYTAAEAVGRHIAMLLPPDAHDEVEMNLARVVEGETVKSYDVVRLTKDGRNIDVSVTRSPIMDEDGRVIGIARIYRDIREQKRAAAAQERLAAIVEHSNDAMVTRTMDGIVTSWNAGAARMFGYTAQEAIGRHVSFLHAPGNVPAIASANERLCRGESVAPFRSERITKDGRAIDVLTSLSPLRGASGEVEGASLIFQDMSQLRRAETALSESERQIRAIFEQAAVGMGLRSADPDNPRWLRVNQKLCDILGYTEAELLQMTSFDVTPPEDVPASMENNRRLLEGSIPAYSRNKRYVRKDGSLIWVNISLSLVRDESGAPLHAIAVVEDITARKNTEMQLARWTSFYAALSETNEAIVRIGDRDTLFKRVCSIAVEKTGLLAAWIGLLDEDTRLVHPVAIAGPAADYAVDITVSIDTRSPAGHGPSGRAIRGNEPYIVRDVATHETADYWKQRAMRRGIRSS
ncbi:MAG TPA: PAS domain S-box protein, partial [Burkholderiales bacterium]|nr:PAS domain S-box protein [Burkholderiales bacterium]